MRIEDQKLAAPVLEIDDALPAVLAAQDALSRVFEQVIENAIHAGAKTVTCSADVEFDRVLISLVNDGTTSDDETFHHAAVRPFFTTRTDGSPGLGLSLASSPARAGRHHQSRSTTGWTRRRGRPHPRCPWPEPRPSGERPAGKKSTTILIIENDPLIASLPRTRSRRGSSCRGHGGCRSRPSLDAHEPACLFCDTRMDDLQLERFLGDARQRYPALDTRIVLVGNERETRMRDRYEAEADYRYLRKPFRVEDAAEPRPLDLQLTRSAEGPNAITHSGMRSCMRKMALRTSATDW